MNCFSFAYFTFRAKQVVPFLPFHIARLNRKGRVRTCGNKSCRTTQISLTIQNTNWNAPFSAADVFSFLALRAQESFCKDTAKADGSGKFLTSGSLVDESRGKDASSTETSKHSANQETIEETHSLVNWCPPQSSLWSDSKMSRMVGGRKFAKATVEVWRASHKSKHPQLGRRFYQGSRNAHIVWIQTSTSSAPVMSGLDSVGVTVCLEPRNLHIPLFRADLRYFELNHGGLWWFVGSADLIISAGSVPNVFRKETEFVHSHWKNLCERHRSAVPFVRDPSQNHIPFGELLGDFDVVERGRCRAFAFVNDFFDTLLTAYLPLTHRKQYSSKQVGINTRRRPHLGYVQLAETAQVWSSYDEIFGLLGGTVLESSFFEQPPVAMWRFNLMPPPTTAAAKTIAELRSGRTSSESDPLSCFPWF
eukprot:jgi/Galph1/3051/GphlegSOOS_G1754.1